MKLEYNRTDNYEDIMNTLEEYGVVVIKNFLEENDLKTLMSDYKNFYDSKINDKKIVADRSVNFNTLRKKKDTFINKRIKSRDGDEGMIDIWNIDKSLTKSNTQLDDIKKFSLNIINGAFNVKYDFKTTNMYINESISQTRGIHSDSGVFPSRVKTFFYMTDINDVHDGPYSFILNSHKGNGKKYWKKYDIFQPLPGDEDKYVIFDTLNKNDLVISCVAGAHRGMPQKQGRKRSALVLSFDPEGHI